ncbi:hypothetical protein GALMADRAFT_136408 [Galerina marginata CBS 339.88]|uniref:Uncharacterized protein n=1 Tax=Galerina marginata (strain CBS 339.88) TaxID=685588 RepID=A0A067T9B7_GALM3|nr:hypothetical protein GALMADRAFT_136408 [Galerina marginata CBS 339.88]
MDIDMKNKDDGDDKGIIAPTNGGSGRDRDFDRDKERDPRDRDYDRDRDRRDKDKDRDRERGDRRDSGENIVVLLDPESETTGSQRDVAAIVVDDPGPVLVLVREDVRRLHVVVAALGLGLGLVPGPGPGLVAGTASQRTPSLALWEAQ